MIITQQLVYNMLMQDKPSTIRGFFGIPVSDDLAGQFSKQLFEVHPELKDQLRQVLPGNHHVTIRFLGNIELEKVPKLIEFAIESTKCIDLFEVYLRFIASFPPNHARSAAVTIQPSKELQSLYDALSFSSSRLDFPLENRPYLPHITLFRSKNKNLKPFEKIFLSNEALEVNEFVLYQSISIEKGIQYKPLHRFQLNATG